MEVMPGGAVIGRLFIIFIMFFVGFLQTISDLLDIYCRSVPRFYGSKLLRFVLVRFVRFGPPCSCLEGLTL